ncbi:MAG: FliM/FliN family flagellar motor switch protein [Planctomycetes bacterium]|nr:FliM/FliN family flagellar motor switch protein [Planctomycetota bacterium]
MKELLSSEEIDTLLELFRAESGSSLAERDVHELREVVDGVLQDAVVSPVDLLKPNRFTSDQIDAAERFFSTTATALAATMMDRLRLDLVCDCVAVEQLRFGDWQARSGAPAAIYVLATPPFDAPGLLTMSARLLHGSVDRILGGTGRVDEPLPQPTAAVNAVAESFVAPLVERLAVSFAEVVKMGCAVERRVGSQALAQIVGPNDVVLSAYLQVGGDQLNGDLRLVLPFAQAEALVSKLGHGRTPDYDAAPGSMRAVVAEAMRPVSVDVVALLGRAELSLRDLLDLQAGDVLAVDRRVGQPLEILVQGRRKFLCTPGRRGRARAVRVETVEQGDARDER